ncbi:LysR family transcriptional regulator ArgP [Microcella sp.]|uniref:LysR family transcriptional regulator ArgP n=1 Tax=Microcella sp. TaxID=1913979 RepID=UPI00256406C2|nr:LysR family transcriptional regulator ArgP [Microcella sp.]MBX9472457.1 LysR family transcriptional regulator ArgP [Microcella sp.]
MTISLELAHTIAAIIDEGTFESAARRLRVTPSAISQRVRALEQQLGRVVLVRSKPVRATEAGTAIVRLARQLALLEHDAMAELGLDDGGTSSLAIAVNADSLATWFLPSLTAVTHSHAVVVDLHRDDQDRTTELLQSGTVMAAVTSQAEPVAGCSSRPLGSMRYEPFAAPAYLERYRSDSTGSGWLRDAPLVQFDRNDQLQHTFLVSKGIDPGDPPRHVIPATHEFAQAVVLGLGWGMLPEAQSATEVTRGALVRLHGDPIDVPLYWQQWNLGSPVMTAIADAVVGAATRSLRPPL